MSYRVESNYKRLGDYIERINVRNNSGEISYLQGINIDKHFMPSVANIVGTDLSRYKIVEPNQFACNRMHVGRDYRLPIAVSEFDHNIIVSPAYDVFKVVDENILNVEYLMMWFSRSEFDRNCWFYTDTDVRGKLGWDSFCDMKMPIPSIEKQNEIVREYNTIVNRINLNETLNQKLEKTAQALYKHWFVDFEFPNEDGEPYKSSGGEMVYCEEVDGEVPVGWEGCLLFDFLEIKYGKSYSHLNQGDIPLYGSGGIMSYVDSYLYDKPSILIPRKGTLSNIMFINHPFWSIDTMFYSIIKEVDYAFYVFYHLSKLDFYALNVGSAVPSMTTEMLINMVLIKPSKTVLKTFNSKLSRLFEIKSRNQNSNNHLIELLNLILSKMTKTENSNEVLKKYSVVKEIMISITDNN